MAEKFLNDAGITFENKLFGLEMLELRFGGQRERLVSTEKVLRLYLDGQLDRLEPLETPLLDPDNKPSREVNSFARYGYRSIISPGVGTSSI